MKALIAILSCQSYKENGNNQAIRETWLPYVQKEPNVDCKIFLGAGSQKEHDDEVTLSVPDDYAHVTYKTREIYRYVLEYGYDYVFKCFPDTYVCPKRLLSSGFEKYDYSGNFACKPPGSPAYCTGGVGYWISKDACKQLANALIPTDIVVEVPPNRRPLRIGLAPNRSTPIAPRIVTNVLTWAEDKWTGELLYRCPHLKTKHDIRYQEDVYGPGPEQDNNIITQHLSRSRGVEGVASSYDKQWLYAKHNKWLNPEFRSREEIDKVAVITPTVSSRSALLKDCEKSVVNQSWKGGIRHAVWEDIFKEGPTAIRNKIVGNLDRSYEWLAFCDDDDILLPEHLEILISNSDGADVIYSDCKEEGFSKTWSTREFDYEAVKADNYIPITCLVRRSMFEKAGGFKIEPPGEDQKLWLRIYEEGGRFVYVPKVTWIYRQHSQHRKHAWHKSQSM